MDQSRVECEHVAARPSCKLVLKLVRVLDAVRERGAPNTTAAAWACASNGRLFRNVREAERVIAHAVLTIHVAASTRSRGPARLLKAHSHQLRAMRVQVITTCTAMVLPLPVTMTSIDVRRRQARLAPSRYYTGRHDLCAHAAQVCTTHMREL